MTILDFYMARCHHCDLEMPFYEREKRDAWVAEHRLACRNAIDTWLHRRFR